MPSIQARLDTLVSEGNRAFNTEQFSSYAGIPNPDVPSTGPINEEIILISNEVSVGVEVELENLASNWRGSGACGNWDVVNDGSLRGVSREIRSRGPVRGDRLREDIHQLFSSFQSNDLVRHANVRTSMHVHVNMLDMTRYEMLAFLVTASLADNILFQHTGENRAFTGYSAPTATKLAKVAGEAATRYSENSVGNGFLGFSVGSLGTRYQSINLQALSKHGTVEFRHFETPGTKQEMVTIINACVAIKLAARELSEYLVTLNELINPEIMYDKAKELLEVAFPEHSTTMNKDDFCELFELGILLASDPANDETTEALFDSVVPQEPVVPADTEEPARDVVYDELTQRFWYDPATYAAPRPHATTSTGTSASYGSNRFIQPTIPTATMDTIASIVGLQGTRLLSTAQVEMPLGATILSGGAEIFRGYQVEPSTMMQPPRASSTMSRHVNMNQIPLHSGSVVRLGRNCSTYAVLMAGSTTGNPLEDVWALVNINPPSSPSYANPLVDAAGDIE